GQQDPPNLAPAHLDAGIAGRLTKRIPPSRSAAADLCGSVLDWTRDGWWFRAWLGRYGMVWGARVQAACSSPVMAMVRPRACRPRMWLRIFLSRLMRLA